MNASLTYVLRNLGRRRTRTVIGVLGIFLTIALLTAIQIGLDSISVSYIDLVSLQAGKADVLVRLQGSDLLNPIAFSPAEATAQLETNSALAGVSPRLLGIAQVQYGGEEHYAVVIGVDPIGEKKLDLWGLKPEPKLDDATCALSKSLASKMKTVQGRKAVIRSPTAYQELELSVGDTVDRQLFLPQQVKDFVVVNLAAARKVLGEPDRVHLLAGALRNPRSYYDARDLRTSVLRLKDAGESIADQLGMRYQVSLPKAQAITAFRDFSSPLRAVFGVFALLSLIITGLLIYSLISVSVEERIREYAILRTLGARRGEIFRLVLGESLILCILGVVPGVFAGTVAAKVLVSLIALAMGTKGGLPVDVTPATLWLTMLGGVLIALGSALVPAWHATRWRIVDALDPLRRGQVLAPPDTEQRPHKALMGTGLLLTSVSVVVFFVLPTAVLSGSPSLIGTVILCLLLAILLGLTLIALGVLPWVQRILFALLGSLFGASSDLAARNLDRHRRRHNTTALLFTLSVSLVMFVASLVALASRTAIALVQHAHGADIKILAWSGTEEALKQELSAIEGVDRVSETRFLRSRSEYGTAYDVVIRDVVGMKDLWVVPFGVDADLAGVLYTNLVVWAGGGPEAISKVAAWAAPAPANRDTNTAAPAILSLSIAQHLDAEVGDLVELSFRLGSVRKDGRFRVVGICSSLPGFQNFRGRVASAVGSGVLIPMETFKAHTQSAPNEAFISGFFIKTRGDRAAQKAVAQRIRDQFDVRYRFGVQCTAEQQEQARVMYWATQVFFGLLLAIAVVIAVFALVASMASAVLERRREIGVLKALGMRRSQLFGLFLAEAVILTLSAGAAGGAIGFLLAWLFVFQASMLMELATVFTMPYLTFAATLGISILAGLLAAHLPTRRLLKQTTAEILRG